jgi:putative nucleotidyltransferase with HDIG domain
MGEPGRIQDFFEVVTRVTRALHESQDSGEALRILVETIAEVFEAKGCALRVVDPASNELELMASTGLSRAYLDKGVVVADSSLSEVYQDSLVVIDDVGNDPRVQYPGAALREGIVSIIGVPFQITGNTRMVLRIYFDREMHLSPQDHHLFYYLAQQSAITIKSSIQRTRYLEAFRKVASAIHEGQEIHDILETIVSWIRELMDARGCIYWIVDTEREHVYMKVTSGFQLSTLSNIDYDTLKEVFSLEEGREVFFEDVRDDGRIPSTTRLGKQQVVSILGVPFHIVGEYTGVLAVYFSHQRSMQQSEVDFIRDCGCQGAIALHKAFRYDERMLQAFRETIEGLVLALEAKDATTHGHSLNVANYAKLTARYMGLPEREAEKLYRGGLLHDIGKIAMQDEILHNLGNLCPVSLETVKKHPQLGAEMLAPLTLLNEVIPQVQYHHERYDGSGYPEGLAGEGIPLEARIIAICDAFDAMTSERPNMEAMGVQKALNILQEQAGTKFDPRVVRAFAQAVRENRDEIQPLKASARKGMTEQADPGSGQRSSFSFPEWLRRFMFGS